MLGYKAFNKDLTCYGGFQYEIGKTYELEGELTMCRNGFHFCRTIQDTYKFYCADSSRICKVEALGDIISKGPKYCTTNKIKILEEITEEWERKGNSNSTSTGYCNTGYHNTGNYNSGDNNVGNGNTGDHNIGDHNTECFNEGSYNTGYHNIGCRNTGNHNTGDYNSGNYNTGSYNTGGYNPGNCNIGDHNTGNHNAGDYNSGNYNIGDFNDGNYNMGSYNKGNRNTGDYNIGHSNVGDFNVGNYNIGCFNLSYGLTNNTMRMFDKESDMTLLDWFQSKAKDILSHIPETVKWVDKYTMTEEEKKNNPDYKTFGGYLKTLDKNIVQLYWDDLSEEDKNEVLSLPNFDKEIFKMCTGIDVGDISI